MYAYICVYIYTYVYIYKYIRTYIYTYIRKHSYVYIYLSTCTHTFLRTHTNARTHTHTHTHTHVATLALLLTATPFRKTHTPYTYHVKFAKFDMSHVKSNVPNLTCPIKCARSNLTMPNFTSFTSQITIDMLSVNLNESCHT